MPAFLKNIHKKQLIILVMLGALFVGLAIPLKAYGIVGAAVAAVGAIAGGVAYGLTGIALVVFLLNLLAQLLLFLFSLIVTAFIAVVQFDLRNFVGFDIGGAVDMVWRLVRDLSNMFFIIVMVMIAFATMLRLEQYKWQRMLGKLVIMAILINFSKTISLIILDFGQLLMMTFVNAFKEIAVDNLIRGLKVPEMSKIAVGALGVLVGQNVEKFLIAPILSIIMLLIATLVMGVILIILLFRMAFIWVLVAISPAAYLMNVLEATKSYWSKWWKFYVTTVFLGPALAFFLWFVFLFMNGPGDILPQDQLEHTLQGINLGEEYGASAASSPLNFTNYAISIVLLIVGTGMAIQAAGWATGIAGGVWGMGGNYAKRRWLEYSTSSKKGGILTSALSAIPIVGKHLASRMPDPRAGLDKFFAAKEAKGSRWAKTARQRLSAIPSARAMLKYLTPEGRAGFKKAGEEELRLVAEIATAQAQREANLIFSGGAIDLPLDELARYKQHKQLAQEVESMGYDELQALAKKIGNIGGEKGDRWKVAISYAMANKGFEDDHMEMYVKPLQKIMRDKWGYTDGRWYDDLAMPDFYVLYNQGKLQKGEGITERDRENLPQDILTMMKNLEHSGGAKTHVEQMGLSYFNKKKGELDLSADNWYYNTDEKKIDDFGFGISMMTGKKLPFKKGYLRAAKINDKGEVEQLSKYLGPNKWSVVVRRGGRDERIPVTTKELKEAGFSGYQPERAQYLLGEVDKMDKAAIAFIAPMMTNAKGEDEEGNAIRGLEPTVVQLELVKRQAAASEMTDRLQARNAPWFAGSRGDLTWDDDLGLGVYTPKDMVTLESLLWRIYHGKKLLASVAIRDSGSARYRPPDADVAIEYTGDFNKSQLPEPLRDMLDAGKIGYKEESGGRFVFGNKSLFGDHETLKDLKGDGKEKVTHSVAKILAQKGKPIDAYNNLRDSDSGDPLVQLVEIQAQAAERNGKDGDSVRKEILQKTIAEHRKAAEAINKGKKEGKKEEAQALPDIRLTELVRAAEAFEAALAEAGTSIAALGSDLAQWKDAYRRLSPENLLRKKVEEELSAKKAAGAQIPDEGAERASLLRSFATTYIHIDKNEVMKRQAQEERIARDRGAADKEVEASGRKDFEAMLGGATGGDFAIDFSEFLKSLSSSLSSLTEGERAIADKLKGIKGNAGLHIPGNQPVQLGLLFDYLSSKFDESFANLAQRQGVEMAQLRQTLRQQFTTQAKSIRLINKGRAGYDARTALTHEQFHEPLQALSPEDIAAIVAQINTHKGKGASSEELLKDIKNIWGVEGTREASEELLVTAMVNETKWSDPSQAQFTLPKEVLGALADKLAEKLGKDVVYKMFGKKFGKLKKQGSALRGHLEEKGF